MRNKGRVTGKEAFAGMTDQQRETTLLMQFNKIQGTTKIIALSNVN